MPTQPRACKQSAPLAHARPLAALAPRAPRRAAAAP